MPEIAMKSVIEQLLGILHEAFEGPSPDGSWFLDVDPSAGWVGTLGKLSAAEASREIGGSTIAAHAHHMAFALDVSAGWIRHDRSRRDWGESWRARTVDGPQWDGLRGRIRAGYEDLSRAIESDAPSDDESMGAAIGAIAHAAYHLGAIRQKIVCMREA